MTVVTKRRGGKEIPQGEIRQYRGKSAKKEVQQDLSKQEAKDALKALFGAEPSAEEKRAQPRPIVQFI